MGAGLLDHYHGCPQEVERRSGDRADARRTGAECGQVLGERLDIVTGSGRRRLLMSEPSGRGNMMFVLNGKGYGNVQARSATARRPRRAGALLASGRLTAGLVMRIYAAPVPGRLQGHAAVPGDAEHHLVRKRKAGKYVYGERRQHGDPGRCRAFQVQVAPFMCLLV